VVGVENRSTGVNNIRIKPSMYQKQTKQPTTLNPSNPAIKASLNNQSIDQSPK
jgi:hypothetical protein